MPKSENRQEPLYVLHWRHKASGQTGNGESIPKELADAWIEAKRSDDAFEYWVEELETRSRSPRR